jgi:hypothetical protein
MIVTLRFAVSPLVGMAASVTVPVNPFTAAMVIVEVPFTFGVVFTIVGVAVMEKSVTLMANAALVLVA